MIAKIKEVFKAWLGIPSQELVNEETKTIFVPEGYSVVYQGDLHIRATGHIIFESGKTIDENGLMRGIWLNPDLDENGKPICYEPIVIEGDQHGDEHRRIE